MKGCSMSDDAENFRLAILDLDGWLQANINAGSSVSDLSREYQSRCIALLDKAQHSNQWDAIAKHLAFLLFAGAVHDVLLPRVTGAFNHIVPDANRGRSFKKGRAKGALSSKTIHIYGLVYVHPEMSAKELFRLADKKVLGGMALGTFSNHVSDAKNSRFIEKRESL